MKKRGTYTEVKVYVLFVCLKLGKNFLVNEKNYLPKMCTRAKKNVASNCVRCGMHRGTFSLIGCFSRRERLDHRNAARSCLGCHVKNGERAVSQRCIQGISMYTGDYMENILQKKMAEAVSLRGCLSVSLSLGCLWRQIIQERKSGNIRPHRSCHRLSTNRILWVENGKRR